jgi:hypothetical protein
MNRRVIGLILCGLLLTLTGRAQTLQVLGNPVINVVTAADYQNGVTVLHNTIQVSVAANVQYSLQAKASGNMTSGVRSIPIGQMRLRATNVPGNTNPGFNLSTIYQTLVSSRQTVAVNNYAITLEYKLAGGTAILQPGGAYTTTITFLLTSP